MDPQSPVEQAQALTQPQGSPAPAPAPAPAPQLKFVVFSPPAQATPGIPSPSRSSSTNADTPAPGGGAGRASRIRIHWLPEMEAALIEALVKEVESGKRSDNGFKKESFVYAHKQVLPHTSTQKLIFNVAHVRFKYDALRKDWNAWTRLMSQPGFSEDVNGIITGDATALRSYFEAHRDARKFRTRPCKYQHELRIIFDRVLANGSEVFTVDEAINNNTLDNVEDEPAASIERIPSVQPSASTERCPSVQPSASTERCPSVQPSASTERCPSAQPSVSTQSPKPALARKRSATQSVARTEEKRGKKLTVTDRMGETAEHLLAIAKAILANDVQTLAIQEFVQTFAALDPGLMLAVIEEFENEFKAKTFICLPSKLRKGWVKTVLLRTQEEHSKIQYNGKSFTEVMDSLDWDRDGDLELVDSITLSHR